MASPQPLTTRRTGHFVVDAALTVLALGLVALVSAVSPSPEVCALSLPTPGPCFPDDRAQIAVITVVSVLAIALGGFIANHLLAGRARSMVVAAAMAAALAVGLLGASSLAFDFWIIHPVWQLA